MITERLRKILNTIVPASPTAGSLNDILSKASGGNTFNKATDSLEAIGEIVAAVKAVTAALQVLTEAGGTVTTDGTEQNVYIADAPTALFKPLVIKVDCTNHTVTETIVVKVYYRIKTGGNYILQTSTTYIGTISPALLSVALDPNLYGVKVTLQKTSGTNRAYDYEVVYEA